MSVLALSSCDEYLVKKRKYHMERKLFPDENSYPNLVVNLQRLTAIQLSSYCSVFFNGTFLKCIQNETQAKTW